MSNKYDSIIAESAAKFAVPFALIKATIAIESAFNPVAHNASDPQGGAWGLGQFLIGTAEWLWAGIKSVTVDMLRDPAFSIESIAKLHAYNLGRYGGQIKDAIAAYNAGSARKKADGSYINQRYVDKVYSQYLKYKALPAPPADGSKLPAVRQPEAGIDESKKKIALIALLAALGIWFWRRSA